MRSAKEYEDFIGVCLDVFFATNHHATVRVRKSLKYRSEIGYRSYSPIIDVSVGPFSGERRVTME